MPGVSIFNGLSENAGVSIVAGVTGDAGEVDDSSSQPIDGQYFTDDAFANPLFSDNTQANKYIAKD